MSLIVVATLSAANTRRLLEIGFALAAIGGASLLLAGLTVRNRAFLSFAGGLIAVGAVLAVAAIHWGVTPWNK